MVFEVFNKRKGKLRKRKMEVKNKSDTRTVSQ